MSTLSSGPGRSMGMNQGAGSGATTSNATTSATAKTVSPPTGATSAGNKKRMGGAGNATSAAVEDSRFKVDKKIVDELLLVCGVIGTNMGNDVGIVPVTDCLNWLQDMQRALRRDDDAFRPISLLLGQWNVVSQKLFPLCLSCRYDTPMLLTICKILVILTKPLSENTVRAGKMVIDTKSKNATPEFIKEQIKLRDNALQQAEQLLEYKRAICHHPSHRQSRKKSKEDKDGSGGSGSGGLLSIFVSLLAEPLGKSRRTDADHLTIELVLHLFRNLLAAEPLLQHDSTSNAQARQLHHEFIQLLDAELVLEILLVLGSDLEQRENAPYNLLVMEILQHLLRHEDPMAVARSNASSSSSSLSSTSNNKNKKSNNKTGGSGALSLLGQTMQREKQTLAVPTMNRHSNFGGTLALKRPHGGEGSKPQYVSTSALAQRNEPLSAAAAAASSSSAAGGEARRKNKRNEPFIGAAASRLQHGRRNRAWHGDGPAAQKAARCLHQFCRRFLQECYGPVMKSLKNEFRRDSVRLEDGDRVVFFRLVWFFSQWWRVTTSSGKHPLQAAPSADKKASTASSTAIGQLIFTMDVFTFNLVLNATDTFIEHKKYARLAQAVSLLAEMMHLLFVLHNSPESTETIMAMGLMDRLFYGTEPMDRLSKLLSKWEPGTGTREYACDLVEVVHMQLKLLESNRDKAAADKDAATVDKKKTKGRKKKGEIDEESTPSDAVANMKAIAADFDVLNYLRKLITNHSVFLYTQLLGQYAVNALQVNHRLVAFFLRLSKFNIVLPENDADDQEEILQNPLAIKTVTLEPMLYNINMLQVLNTILNDSIIRHDKDYTTTLQFASNLMFNFSQAAAANPMLYVEALLKHSAPARFCDSVTNQYVTEELRMMVERDMLLEDQQQRREAMFEQDEEDDGARDSNGNDKAGNKNSNDDDDDSDEELEFEDFGLISGSSQKSTKSKGKKSKRKVLPEDSDDDDDDDKSDDEGDATSKPASVAAKHPVPASKHAGNQNLDDVDDSDDEGAATSKSAADASMKAGEQGLDDSDDEEIGTARTTTKSSSDDESSTARSNAARNLKKNQDDDDKATSSPKSRHTAKAATALDKVDDSDDSTVDGKGAATGEKSASEKEVYNSKKKRSKSFEDASDDDDELVSKGDDAKKESSGDRDINTASRPSKKKARTTGIEKDESSDSESDSE